MGKPGFYLYTGDLLRDTSCLTPEAFGVYCRWLFGPLLQNQGTVTWPIIALANVANVGEELARNVLLQLALTGVAEVEWVNENGAPEEVDFAMPNKMANDGKGMAKHSKITMAKLSNRRMVREHQTRLETKDKRATAGRKGASKRWQNSDGKNAPLPSPSLLISIKKKNKNSSSRPKSPPSDQGIELAQLLSDLIAENTPNRTPPTEAQLLKWAREADLINRIDRHPFEEIEKLLRWSQQDSFWKANILSMGKFREKWNQLAAKAGRTAHTNGANHGKRPAAEPKGFAAIHEVLAEIAENESQGVHGTVE